MDEQFRHTHVGQGKTNLLSRLAIGTVQFGLDYGISNRNGKTGLDEAGRILDFAARHGIELLDTAPAYGASEQALGSLIPMNTSFKIVTKTAVFHDDLTISTRASYLKEIFQTSLENLKQSSVYGLLVHRADDLLTPGAERLWNAMEELKEQGRVEKIGVSVYTSEQIDRISALFPIDLIQVPLNVFDQRLLRSGHLTALKSMGVEIHVRSVFLQGLLLMNPSDLPGGFTAFADHIHHYHRIIKAANITPLQAALGFAAGLPAIDRIICGVNTCGQLEEICSMNIPDGTLDYAEFASSDTCLIDPSQWKNQ